MNKIVVTFLSTMVINICIAQKLPKVQQGSYRAPAGIKVDGKIRDWGELKAYNSATQIYYTLANNDEYLYLVVKASAPDILYKIARGGITLTVNTAAKKRQAGSHAITFPMYEEAGSKMFTSFNNKLERTGNMAKDKASQDSLVAEKNKLLGQHFKWIGTANIKDVTDSLISIYNAHGIKVSYAIDGDLNYNYELAVPLKCLELTGAFDKFFYNISLNGEILYFENAREVRPGRFVLRKKNDNREYGLGFPSSPITIFATDFWGEYTLAR